MRTVLLCVGLAVVAFAVSLVAMRAVPQRGAAAAAADSGSEQDEGITDYDRLAGSWESVSPSNDEKATLPEEVEFTASSILVPTGGSFRRLDGKLLNPVALFDYALHKPNRMALTAKGAAGEVVKLHALYAISGDVLKIVVSGTAEYPASMASAKQVWLLRRKPVGR